MKILKKLLILLFIIYAVVIFFPKKNLYYLFEKQASKQEFVLFDETVSDFGLLFYVNNAKISFKDINAGKIQQVRIFLALFANQIKFENVALNDTMKRFLPQKLDNLSIFYTPFYPMSAFISSNGDFGEISGSFGLFSKKITLALKPSELMNTKYKDILNNFKKVKGEYIYEFSFK